MAPLYMALLKLKNSYSEAVHKKASANTALVFNFESTTTLPLSTA
jgi:hypothetical protein